jgi:hypothetical protein
MRVLHPPLCQVGASALRRIMGSCGCHTYLGQSTGPASVQCVLELLRYKNGTCVRDTKMRQLSFAPFWLYCFQ